MRFSAARQAQVKTIVENDVQAAIVICGLGSNCFDSSGIRKRGITANIQMIQRLRDLNKFEKRCFILLGKCYVVLLEIFHTISSLHCKKIYRNKIFSIQELIWHIVNNVDIEGSKKLPLYARSPFLDAEAILPEEAKALVVGSASEDKKKLVEEMNFNSIGYAENVSCQMSNNKKYSNILDYTKEFQLTESEC